jgi:hypothetical protein
MSQDPLVPHKDAIDEPPPLLGTWPRVYTAVIGYLFLLIVLFYLFSRAWAV